MFVRVSDISDKFGFNELSGAIKKKALLAIESGPRYCADWLQITPTSARWQFGDVSSIFIWSLWSGAEERG